MNVNVIRLCLYYILSLGLVFIMCERKMNDEQWRAIKNCDKSYDGKFFYALKTTKNICKPSCTARTPNPKNVEIFYSVEDAKKYGYRPCKRCRPDNMDWQGSKIEWAEKIKNYIDINYAEKISPKHLGKILYGDPYYLHRVFKKIVGVTIMEYQHQVRIKQAAILLAKTDLSISYIAFKVGYLTLSHFSRVFKNITGISPSRYRAENKPNK